MAAINKQAGASTRGRVRGAKGRYIPEAPTERHRAAMRDVANGVPIRKALPAHGFSAAQADKGMAYIQASGPLRAAWHDVVMESAAKTMPSLEHRRAAWWDIAMTDLVRRSNKAVPILRVAGTALGVLAPENQTLVQVNVAAPSQAAAQWEDTEPDTQPATLPDTVTTK